MKKLFVYFCLFILLVSSNATAELPTTERLPASEGAPVDVLSGEPDGVFLITSGDYKDKLLVSWEGSDLTLVDLETWALASDQPESFPNSIVDVKLLSDNVTLVIALTNGDIATIDLSDSSTFDNTTDSDHDDDEDEEDSRVAKVSDQMTDAGITAIAIDPDENSDTIYMIDENSQTYYEYDLSSEDLNFIDFVDDDSSTTDYTPTHIVFAESNAGDLVLLTTTNGEVLVSSPGSFSFTAISVVVRTDDSTDPNFAKAILTPDNNHAYIIDSTNDVIWVYSFSSSNFVDQLTGETSLDPIEFDDTDENASLTDITFIEDESAETIYGYVAGDQGISIIDATDPDEKSSSKVIDTNSDTSDIFEAIPLSGSATFMASFSSDILTVLSANSDGTLSVLSDNPFVTISSASVDPVTSTDSSFTLTFQSDEAGTYTVYANSNPSQDSGTELISATTLETADTDTTTASIDIDDFDRDVFIEGENKVYVFVTDEAGNTGWDAYALTVDRPPSAVSITASAFGNGRLYLSFTPSEDADIANYTLYAEPAANSNNPTCPGTLIFTSENTVTASISPSVCSESSCTGEITGLTNSTVYCVAISVTDESDQTSSLNAFTTPLTPDATSGPAQFLGETNCALSTQAQNNPALKWILFFVFFLLLKKRASSKQTIIPLLILCFLFTPQAHAEELSPQQWSLEVKGTYWFPTRREVKDFIDDCCNLMGEVEFGWLPQKMLNVTGSVGFGYRSGNSIGITTLAESEDNFKMLWIPFRGDFIFRLDLKEDQLFLPYARVGLDAFLFREYGSSTNIWNVKYGAHGGIGIGVLLDRIEPLDLFFERELGVNDVYLTFEGRYAHINSFSQTGMDFSGIYTSVGLLFLF